MAIRFSGDKKRFERFSRQMGRAFPVILEDIAVRAEKQIFDNFRREGFEDTALERWPARKNDRASQLKRQSRRALLVRTGKMRNSWAVRRRGNMVRVFNTARSKTGVPYPLFHQKGTSKMPRRKMVGPSKAMNRRIIKRDIIPQIKKALGK